MVGGSGLFGVVVVVVVKSWALTFNEFLRVFGHRNRIQLEILGRNSQVLILGIFLKVSKQKKLFLTAAL